MPLSDTIAIADLRVGRLGFGALRITGPGGLDEPADAEGARAVVRRAVELGVTLIDTADSYGPGVSERLIAEALHPYPQGVVIATKAGLVHGTNQRWRRDAHPDRIRAGCEGSLRRLRLERIDLFQLHAPDPRVPIEESMGTLADLAAEGKVRHVGVCNVDEEELERARGVMPVVSVQNRYNLGHRHWDPLVDVCERDGLAFMPWYPLARGTLAGAGGGLGEVARRRGITPAQAAIAWLLARSPAMLPIPGTSSIEHLEQNVAAAALTLDDEELATIEG